MFLLFLSLASSITETQGTNKVMTYFPSSPSLFSSQSFKFKAKYKDTFFILSGVPNNFYTMTVKIKDYGTEYTATLSSSNSILFANDPSAYYEIDDIQTGDYYFKAVSLENLCPDSIFISNSNLMDDTITCPACEQCCFIQANAEADDFYVSTSNGQTILYKHYDYDQYNTTATLDPIKNMYKIKGGISPALFFVNSQCSQSTTVTIQGSSSFTGKIPYKFKWKLFRKKDSGIPTIFGHFPNIPTIVGVIFAIFVAIFVVTIICVCIRRKKKKNAIKGRSSSSSSSSSSKKGKPPIVNYNQPNNGIPQIYQQYPQQMPPNYQYQPNMPQQQYPPSPYQNISPEQAQQYSPEQYQQYQMQNPQQGYYQQPIPGAVYPQADQYPTVVPQERM